MVTQIVASTRIDTRFELTPFCSFIACSGWRIIIIIIVIPPIPTLIHGTDSEPESASNNKWKCPSSTHHIPAKDETELARGSVRDQTRHHTLARVWKGGEQTEEKQGRDNVLNKGRRSRVSRQTTTVCSGGCLLVVFHSPHPPPLFIHRPYPYIYRRGEGFLEVIYTFPKDVCLGCFVLRRDWRGGRGL